MTKSASFGLHRPGFYSELGFRTDGVGLTEDSLIEAGGSLAECEKFLKLAQASGRDPPSKKRKEPEDGINYKGGGSSNKDEFEVKPGSSQSDAKAGRAKITDLFEMTRTSYLRWKF